MDYCLHSGIFSELWLYVYVCVFSECAQELCGCSRTVDFSARSCNESLVRGYSVTSITLSSVSLDEYVTACLFILPLKVFF